MTVKLLAFLTRRKDLSRSEFVEWYEANHVPMILEVTPGLVDYRRNFLPETTAGVDVITELTYRDQAAFEHAMEVSRRPAVWDRIARDQAFLFDPDGIRIVVADERGGAVTVPGRGENT